MPTSPNGVLVVDKPSGPTSFDIVADIRRHLHTRQVGHAGTLDPLATGVLVVLIGEATKLSDHLTAAEKSYSAQLRFGCSTDTLDTLGKSTEQLSTTPGWLSERILNHAIELELHRTLQVPPAYSAIKQGGKKSYDRARRGETVQHAPRPVGVRKLAVTRWTDELVELDLTVTKGYYVRSLARDLCSTLGVPGCLSALRRTASGCFTLSDACQWPPDADMLMSVELAARRALPIATLNEVGVERARHGKRLTASDFESPPPHALAAWFSAGGALVALGRPDLKQPSEPMPGQAAEPEPTPLYRVTRGFRDNPT